MKLVFYSSGGTTEDRELDAHVASLIGPSGTIAYIPSRSGATAERYYEGMQSWYRPHGVTKFRYFAADVDYSDPSLLDTLESEAIFLSGGNTFSFLKVLHDRELMPQLIEYVRRGGILIGQSAGGIIMTPHIAIAQALVGGGDENAVGLKDLTGLGLVGFEFAPHFEVGHDSLTRYSSKQESPIYACPNGSGIAVCDTSAIFFGRVTCLHRGASYPVAIA